MRRAFLITGLMTAFAVAVLAAGAAGANFGGNWVLDKTKSQGLDPRMQNADVTWVITQDDKQISIETKVAGGQPPATFVSMEICLSSCVITQVTSAFCILGSRP